MVRTLQLTLMREWFDLILSGEKTVEYREIKPYWTSRLFDSDGNPKVFDEILFRNGYGIDRPSMRVEYLGLVVTDRYELLLGEVLDSWNL